MKRFWQTILLLAFSTLAFSQNPLYNNQWRFGVNGGLDFNFQPPQPVSGAALQTNEGSASVADPETGQILFYTDGSTLWNALNQPMPNGTGLSGGATFSSTTAAVIVPRPFRPREYYVVTIDEQFGNRGVRYNLVNMDLDNGRGDIVPGQKNRVLFSTNSEKLEVIPAGDQCSFWLLTHNNPGNTFYAFRISQDGFSANPVVSETGPTHGNGAGHMKVNRQGNRLAMSNISTMSVELYDFDRNTGQVSNPRTWMFPGNDANVYGVEFSPTGRFLYVTNLQKIVQFDVSLPTTSAILGSAFDVSQGLFPYTPATLQLGPDDRIYVATGGVDIIAAPDQAGEACTLVSPGIQLSEGGTGYGLPKRVLGLHSPANQIVVNDTCQRDSIRFSLLSPGSGFESLEWSFGDPGSGAANTSTRLAPAHFFATPGTYTIQVVLRYACFTDTLRRTLEVQPCRLFSLRREGDTCQLAQSFRLVSLGEVDVPVRWSFGDPQSGAADSLLVAAGQGNEAVSHTFSRGGQSYTVCVRFRIPGEAETRLCRTFSVGNCCIGELATADSCLEDSVTLRWESFKTPLEIRWDFGDPASGPANFSTNTTGRHRFSGPGTYAVRARVRLDCGTLDKELRLTVKACRPAPLCRAEIEVLDSCLERGIPFRLRSESAVQAVTWNFGDPGSGTNASDLPEPRKVFSGTGEYRIRAFVQLACGLVPAEKSIRIERCGLNCALRLPNLLLPDGRESNRRIGLQSDCPIVRGRIRVFNRWGVRLFETESDNPEWDGREAEEGVYYVEGEADREDGRTDRVQTWVWLKPGQ